MWFMKDIVLVKNDIEGVWFKGKTITENKRGAVANFYPKVINEKEHADIVALAEVKTSKSYRENVYTEYKFMTKANLDADELIRFKKTHAFWVKEDIDLLKAYRNLYYNFYRDIKNCQNRNSKNIISMHPDTCISSLQLHGDTLIVTQRSCDLSLGLFADALTINLFKTELGCRKLVWLIAVPHIYMNNIENTIKYFGDPKSDERKFIFNVRR